MKPLGLVPGLPEIGAHDLRELGFRLDALATTNQGPGYRQGVLRLRVILGRFRIHQEFAGLATQANVRHRGERRSP